MNSPAVSSSEKAPAIFISTNRRYRWYVNNLIGSIIRHNPETPDIIVAVTDDVQKSDIINHSSVRLIQNSLPSDGLSSLPYHGKWVNPATYYGRLIPFRDNEQFKQYGNVLYLDGDTVVCNNLHPLLTQPWFFQVSSPDPKYSPFHGLTDHTIQKLCLNQAHKLKPETKGNSGVILIPESVRNDNTYDELRRIQEEYGSHFRWADQSLFAFWMAKHQIKPQEDARWNYTGPDYRRFERDGTQMTYSPGKPEDAVIYHINNGHRPVKGLVEARMVATLWARVTMKILSALRA